MPPNSVLHAVAIVHSTSTDDLFDPKLTMPETAVEWINTTPQEAHKLAGRAVEAGHEGYDGSPLWLIRARYEGDLIPGKLAVNHQAAYVSWGGKDVAVQDIEVCCVRSPHKVRWEKGNRDGIISPDAIVAGRTSDGEATYAGRALWELSMTPGKVVPSLKVLYIAYGGKEIAIQDYEIMCGEVSPIVWVRTTPEEAHKLGDRGVLIGGREGYDGSQLWVIRASFQGDLVPGKFAARHKAAYVPWGGKENPVHDIEVCCADINRIKWKEGNRDGTLPANAVIGGYIKNSGESLYLGRAEYKDAKTPGKIQLSEKRLYISFEGKEIALMDYEYLCAD